MAGAALAFEMEMTNSKLDPRTDIAIPKSPMTNGNFIPGLCNKDVFRAMIQEARAAFGIRDGVQFGFTNGYDGRLFYQVIGDPTPYSTAFLPEHAKAVSFINVRKGRKSAVGAL